VIIDRIRLKNFKSHINSDIKLDTGVSLILGENGAGKSSILEAISFAFFKEYSAKKIERLINNDSDAMSVEVEFIANGRRYKVFRGRGRRSSPDAVLYREGSLIRAGDNGVTREIEEVIDLDKNLFSNAIYIKQGEIADLITKKPSERKKIIARLLGIDDLQKAWENMRSVIDAYDRRKSRIEGRLEDFGRTKEEKRRKEEEKGEIEDNMRVCERDMKSARRDLEMVEREKELFDKKEDEFNRLSQTIEHEEKLLKVAYGNKERLEENLGSIEKKEKEIKKIEPETKKIPILEDIKDNITVRNGLNEKIENIRAEIKRIEEYQEIKRKNKAGYDLFIKLGDEIDELLKEREEFEGSRELGEAYRKDEKRVFGDIERLNRNISEKLAEYGKILNIDARSVFDLDCGLEIVTSDLEDELKDKEDSIKEISSKRYDLNGQNSEIKKARDELSGAKNRCPVCNAKLTEEHKKELLEKYSDHISKNDDLISSMDDELMRIRLERDELAKRGEKVRRINIAVLKGYSNDLREKKSRIDEIKENLRNVDEKILLLNKIEEERDRKEKERKGVEEPYNKYTDAEKSLQLSKDPCRLREELKEHEDKTRSLKCEIDRMGREVSISPEEVDFSLKKLRTLEGKLNVLKGEVKDKQRVLEELDRTNNDIKDHREEEKTLGYRIEEISYDEERHREIEMEFKERRERYNSLEGKRRELNGRFKEISARIKELGEKIDKFKEYEEELKRLSKFIKFLKDLRDIYGKDGVQKALRERSMPMIERYTREFFNEFGFEYSDIKLSEDYEVTLFGPSGENTLDMMSGGEKISIALALRLGIAKALAMGKIELMILDEPTIHLDSQRRHDLIDVFKKLSAIPQMIIVTHDADLEEAADYVLTITKEGGRSRVVEV